MDLDLLMNKFATAPAVGGNLIMYFANTKG